MQIVVHTTESVFDHHYIISERNLNEAARSPGQATQGSLTTVTLFGHQRVAETLDLLDVGP